MSEMQNRVRAALTDAMRRRDKPAMTALRSALAALANAEAVPVETMPRAGAVEATQLGVGAADAPRRSLTADEERATIESEIAERDAAAARLAATHPDRAASVSREGEVLRALLDGTMNP